MLNILILVSGNSETCNKDNFTFWVTEILCSYMQLKILLQFVSFKIHFMKIQLSFTVLRKISENKYIFRNFKIQVDISKYFFVNTTTLMRNFTVFYFFYLLRIIVTNHNN